MTKSNPVGEPGDLIINRYLPDASEAEREQAREDLRQFASALINVAARVEIERRAGKEAANSNPNAER